jgi:hypothetical protein
MTVRARYPTRTMREAEPKPPTAHLIRKLTYIPENVPAN